MAKWTVLIYMIASKDAELDAAAVRDLREIELGMSRRAEAKKDGVEVIVQIQRRWPEAPQRYKIEQTTTPMTRPGNKRYDMLYDGAKEPKKLGDREVLKNFLIENSERRETRPETDKYALVLWGHSYGLGFGRDHGEPLTLDDLKFALEAFTKHAGGTLDLLGANACAMGYVEAGCEIAGGVKYLAASQIAVPNAGWPYHSILGQLDKDDAAQAFGELIVEHYVNSFGEVPTGDRVSMSLFNLSLTGKLETRFKALADALDPLTRGDNLATRLAHLRAAFRITAAGDVRPLLDLTDLCGRLKELSTDLRSLDLVIPANARALEVAAQDMRDFLKPSADKFIVVHRKNDELEGLNGVGVFAPFVTDVLDLRRLELIADDKSDLDAYKALKLVEETWATLVYDKLGASLSEDVLNNTASSGAATRADRRAVSQILLSVDALFDVLDRRIEASSEALLGALRPADTSGGRPIRTPAKLTTLFPTELQLLGYDTLRQEAERQAKLNGSEGSTSSARRSTSSASRSGIRPTNGFVSAASSFKNIEAMLGSVERAVSRTLTNGTYGLGPGIATSVAGLGGERDAVDPKPAGGLGLDPKPAGSLGLDPKPAGRLGLDPKPANRLGAAGEVDAPNAPSPAGRVAALFGKVGTAMAAVETALGDLETAAALAVSQSRAASGLGVVRTEPPVQMQLKRGFDLLRDASTEARRTLGAVLTHPVYGIGPGPGSISVDDRRAMARDGGFSSSGLTLLSAPPDADLGVTPAPPRTRSKKAAKKTAKRAPKKTARKAAKKAAEKTARKQAARKPASQSR